MKKFSTLLFLLFFLPSLAQDRLTGEPFTTRSEILARNGMAATSQPLATQVALDILKKGGSAMDAAIAANAVLGLVEPASCGIGGDLFAIVWSARDEKLYGFNGSGRSPRSISIDHFKEGGMKYVPFTGPLPVTVPGDGETTLRLGFAPPTLGTFEATAVLVLEAEDHARARGAPVLAELVGYGATGDGHHITAPDPEGLGAMAVMRAALAEAGVGPADAHLADGAGALFGLAVYLLWCRRGGRGRSLRLANQCRS